MTTKINDVEPQKVDAQLLYVCPDTDCRMEHWLSMKQVKTPGFMVVCDFCDTVFTPRLVKSVTLNFLEVDPPKQRPSAPTPTPPVVSVTPAEPIKNKIKEVVTETIKAKPRDFLKEAKETLIHFGFHKHEADEMIEAEYKKTKSSSPVQLVKGALDFLGGKK